MADNTPHQDGEPSAHTTTTADPGTVVPVPRGDVTTEQAPVNEVTMGMVERLRAGGPGALLVLDLGTRSYRVTHASEVTFDETRVVIVYGHGDLVLDTGYLGVEEMSTPDGFGDAIGATVEQLVTKRAWRLCPDPDVSVFRRAMRERGFLLDQRPHHSVSEGWTVMNEFFVSAADPHIRVFAVIEPDLGPGRRARVRVDDEPGVLSWVTPGPWRLGAGLRVTKLTSVDCEPRPA